jgi:hypothetical protein
MHEWPILVISSGARDLAFLATCEEKISRLGLEMTIATQSPTAGEERGGGANSACFDLQANPLFSALVWRYFELATDARKPVGSSTRVCHR